MKAEEWECNTEGWWEVWTWAWTWHPFLAERRGTYRNKEEARIAARILARSGTPREYGIEHETCVAICPFNDGSKMELLKKDGEINEELCA